VNEAAEFVFRVYRRAYGREPNEYEASYYLHRLLIGKVSLGVAEAEILRGADEQFVRQNWQRLAGRAPAEHEMQRGMLLCALGSRGREALLEELAGHTSSPAEKDELALDGVAFLRAAWLLTAGREPTDAELTDADARFRAGVLSKAELLRQLGRPVTEEERWFERRFVGPLLRAVRRTPELEREVGGLRYRLRELERDKD
jgi:hypothetical protein